jgi:hypothetical protein
VKPLDLPQVQKHAQRASNDLDLALWRIPPDDGNLFDVIAAAAAKIQGFCVETETFDLDEREYVFGHIFPE